MKRPASRLKFLSTRPRALREESMGLTLTGGSGPTRRPRKTGASHRAADPPIKPELGIRAEDGRFGGRGWTVRRC
jgi:hypothetical protein